jgi:hypothetical protein
VVEVNPPQPAERAPRGVLPGSIESVIAVKRKQIERLENKIKDAQFDMKCLKEAVKHLEKALELQGKIQ